MNKTMSMCICISEEEVKKYSSYNEFVRRAVLKEPTMVIAENIEKEEEEIWLILMKPFLR